MANKIMSLSSSHLTMHYATQSLLSHRIVQTSCPFGSIRLVCKDNPGQGVAFTFVILYLLLKKMHLNMRGAVFIASVMVISLFCLGKSIISLSE